jgi:23S rRNA-/tRNA-specific pseudouridylate synthase
MENPKCSDSDDAPQALDLPGLGSVAVLHVDDSVLALDKPADCPVRPAVPTANRPPAASEDPSAPLSAIDAPGTVDTASPTPSADTPAPVPTEDLETALNLALAAEAAEAGIGQARRLQALHHLDSEATGILLFSRSDSAALAFRRLLDKRAVLFQHLAVVGGKPKHRSWTCCLKIQPDPRFPGRVLTDTQVGRFAETDFEVLAHGDGMALILASTGTDRLHQIRVHLAAAGLPILGDQLYGFGRDLPRSGRRDHIIARTAPRKTGPDAGTATHRSRIPLALRTIRIGYRDPATRTPIEINAAFDDFLAPFGFDAELDAGEESAEVDQQ